MIQVGSRVILNLYRGLRQPTFLVIGLYTYAGSQHTWAVVLDEYGDVRRGYSIAELGEI